MSAAAAAGGGSSRATSTVFIGSLPFDVTEQDVTTIFNTVGPVKSLRLVTDKDTGKLKGYGFCEYHDQFAAESAVRNLDGHDLNSRKLRVSFAEENVREHEARRDDRRRDRDRPPPLHRDGRPALPPGAPGTKPVTVGVAGAAAGAMASMLGGPPAQGPSQAHVNSVLGGMTPLQLYELMSQMRSLIQQDPSRARQTLISNPQLTKALFQSQILLGMVKPPPGSLGGSPPVVAVPPRPLPVPAPVAEFMPQPGPYHGPPASMAPPPSYAPPQQGYPGMQGGPMPMQVAIDPAQYGMMQQQQLQLQQQQQQQQQQQPAPMQQQQPVPVPAAAPLPNDQQAILAQVMSMTQQQIDALPEATRHQVMQVKQLLISQGAL